MRFAPLLLLIELLLDLQFLLLPQLLPYLLLSLQFQLLLKLLLFSYLLL